MKALAQTKRNELKAERDKDLFDDYASDYASDLGTQNLVCMHESIVVAVVQCAFSAGDNLADLAGDLAGAFGDCVLNGCDWGEFAMEVAKTAVTAAISAIPFVGGFLSGLVGLFWPGGGQKSIWEQVCGTVLLALVHICVWMIRL